jgi:DNA protecting protein DprA
MYVPDRGSAYDTTYQHEVLAWLALSTIEGVGYWTLKRLARAAPSWKALLKVSTRDEFVELVRAVGGKPRLRDGREPWEDSQSRLWAAGKRLLRRLSARDITLLLPDDPLFPPLLMDAPDPPAWIFVEGNPRALQLPLVAIVGTRKPTADGLYLATHIGHCLPLFGAATISGLAMGIDQVAHELSIRHSVSTIAVLGTGILRDFPSGSEELRRRIVEHGGAVISEYLPDDSYSAENFVRRNRIQAALSRVVIPVEWAIKSGTAHTVDNAIRMRRPLVCPRLPDWNSRSELLFAASHGAEVVTVPGEEAKLIGVVRRHLQELPEPARRDQLQLSFEAGERA